MGPPWGPVPERQIHLPTSFLTFALRLQPFAPEFCRRSPVCSENDAFPERIGYLNSGGEFTFRCRRMLRRFQILLRFSTFALRLRPFGSVFGDGAPVCNENDAFPERNGYLNFRDGAPVCSENDSFFFGFPRFRKLSFSLQVCRVAPWKRKRRRAPGAAARIQAGDPNGLLFLNPY